MRTVTAREANQRFSKILEAAVSGEEITITRRGVPVAKLVPVSAAEAEAAQARRIAELTEHLRAGALRGGCVVDWTRDELYDRDADRVESDECG
jgi:prevent-host-death family protein